MVNTRNTNKERKNKGNETDKKEREMFRAKQEQREGGQIKASLTPSEKENSITTKTGNR